MADQCYFITICINSAAITNLSNMNFIYKTILDTRLTRAVTEPSHYLCCPDGFLCPRSACQVTLMLMDQGPSRKHLGDAFKPDPNSSSFRRPAAEMNIASGCPLFVSQSILETGSYIKDDTIFIKVRTPAVTGQRICALPPGQFLFIGLICRLPWIPLTSLTHDVMTAFTLLV